MSCGLLVIKMNGVGAFIQFTHVTYITLFMVYASKEVKMKSMKLYANFECWVSKVSDCINYSSIPWKFQTYFCGDSVCWIGNRHVLMQEFLQETFKVPT